MSNQTRRQQFEAEMLYEVETQDEDGFPIGADVSGEDRKAAREAAVKTIDLTPTPNGYREMIRQIKTRSTVKADREWAAAELERVANVTAWGPQR